MPTQPRRRIRGKRPAAAFEHPATAPKLPATKRVAPGNSKLRRAIRDGAAPKARNPFALFIAEKYPTRPDLRELSAMWRDMSEDAKAPYRTMAKKERDAQRSVAEAIGCRTRRIHKAPMATEDEGKAAEGERAKEEDDKTPAAKEKAEAVGMMEPKSLDFGAFLLAPGSYVHEGSYGTIYKARASSTGCVVALKIFAGRDGDLSACHEFNIYTMLKAAPHSSFLDMLAMCSSPGMSWMAMPYVPTGSVKHALDVRPDEVSDATSAWCIAAQLAQGLAHLHGVGYLHLDLKPGNLLWQPFLQELKIVDFGMSEKIGMPDKANGIPFDYMEYGTPAYRAPELFFRDATLCPAGMVRAAFTKAVDYWAFGCVMYEVCTRKMRFLSGSIGIQTYLWRSKRNHAKAVLLYHDDEELLGNVHGMVRGAMRPDPEHRGLPSQSVLDRTKPW